MNSPIASISTMAVAAYCRSSRSREAPKYCEISTPAPMEKPMASAVNRTVSDAQAPTGGKRLLAVEIADNDGVGGIIELLQKVSRHDRQRKL